METPKEILHYEGKAGQVFKLIALLAKTQGDKTLGELAKCR